MTRTAKRAFLIGSLVVAATAVAVVHGVRDARGDAKAPEASERYDAYDGGPVPIRRLYEPLEPIALIGLPRMLGNRFAYAA